MLKIQLKNVKDTKNITEETVEEVKDIKKR